MEMFNPRCFRQSEKAKGGAIDLSESRFSIANKNKDFPTIFPATAATLKCNSLYYEDIEKFGGLEIPSMSSSR